MSSHSRGRREEGARTSHVPNTLLSILGTRSIHEQGWKQRDLSKQFSDAPLSMCLPGPDSKNSSEIKTYLVPTVPGERLILPEITTEAEADPLAVRLCQE